MWGGGVWREVSAPVLHQGGDVGWERAEVGGEGREGESRRWVKRRPFYQLSKTRCNWETTV